MLPPSESELNADIEERLFRVEKNILASGMKRFSDFELKRLYEQEQQKLLALPSATQMAMSLMPGAQGGLPGASAPGMPQGGLPVA